MAQAETIKFGEFLFKVEDPDAPNVFFAPCGITSRSLDFTKATNETNVPDCDNDDLASWLERDVVSLSSAISGTGVLDRNAHATWRKWAFATDSWRCRIETAGSLANGGGYYQGYYHLTKFSPKADRGQRVTMDVSLDSDGQVAWVDAA